MTLLIEVDLAETLAGDDVALVHCELLRAVEKALKGMFGSGTYMQRWWSRHEEIPAGDPCGTRAGI